MPLIVSSKLDYCNSLLYNLPDKSINRFRCVQNSLARADVPSCKGYIVLLILSQKIHWLPVKKRIEFKIFTIAFKLLQNKQPSYLFDMLHIYNPSRDLRSSGKLLPAKTY